jgi:hypothetical protein
MRDKLERVRALATELWPERGGPLPLGHLRVLREEFARRFPADAPSPDRFRGWCQDIGLQVARKDKKPTQ